MDVLTWLDGSAVGIWIRESPSLWAYPGIITCHTVGLAMLVGINAAVDLMILASVPGPTLAPMARLFPVMWLGFWLNAISGVLLLVADALVMLVNPVMYLKLGLVALGAIVMRRITHGVFRDLSAPGPVGAKGRVLAAASLGIWTAAIIAGRLTAYIGLPAL